MLYLGTYVYCFQRPPGVQCCTFNGHDDGLLRSQPLRRVLVLCTGKMVETIHPYTLVQVFSFHVRIHCRQEEEEEDDEDDDHGWYQWPPLLGAKKLPTQQASIRWWELWCPQWMWVNVLLKANGWMSRSFFFGSFCLKISFLSEE